MSDEEKPLQRITELTIAGERYELAANGKAHLVQRQVKDAYGIPIATTVDLFEWTGGSTKCQDIIQSLLDHLVTAHRQLQTSRDSRLGVGKDTEK